MDLEKRFELDFSNLDSLTSEEQIEMLHKCEEALHFVLDAYNTLLDKHYGRHSEKWVDPAQGDLFNSPEAIDKLGSHDEVEEDSPEESGENREKRSYEKRKGKQDLLKLSPDTKVIVINKDDGSAPKCEACGSEMVKVGEKFQDQVMRVTETVIVRTVFPVYECRNCDGRGLETVSDDSMLSGTVCDPSLLANVIYEKYVKSVPLYRQEEAFRTEGIGITRSLMSSLIMKTGNRLKDNLGAVLEEDVDACDLINADETTCKVISLMDDEGNPKAPNSRANAFMTVRRGFYKDGSPGPVCFNYTDNRRNATIADYFTNYHGIVQSDGLSGYVHAEKTFGFVHCGCLMHARRKAFEAADGRKSGTAVEMMKIYNRIFHFESFLNDHFRKGNISEEKFLIVRRSVLLPLFKQLYALCVKYRPLNLAEKLRVAVNYFYKNYESLIRFLDYSFVTSSNAAAENAIRPFSLGRKNFLFFISEAGADVSAFYYSLVETCKAKGINPVHYLTHLFMNAGKIKNSDVAAWKALLPGNCDLSDAIEHISLVNSAAPDPDRTEPYILRGKRI